MKYKSQTFSQASGSVGGLTFSRGKGGNYTRARAIPTNRNSAGQIAQRAKFQFFTQAWSQLSAAERNAWNSAANLPEWKVKNTLGDMISLSGKALYMKLNLNLAMIGTTVINTPPAFISKPAVTDLSLDITSESFEVTFNADSDTYNTYLIWATPPMGMGVSYNANLFRFLKAVTTTSPAECFTEYQALFGGTPVNYQQAFCRVYIMDNRYGIQGPWAEAQSNG